MEKETSLLTMCLGFGKQYLLEVLVASGSCWGVAPIPYSIFVIDVGQRRVAVG